MYTLKKYRDKKSHLECINLQNKKNSLIICPEYGAAISKLILNGKTLILSPKKINSPHVYASSILFPFANRIENGMYTFNGETQQLNQNEISNKHAIHGLIYNKQFKIESYLLKSKKASITLSYTTKEKGFKGYPFGFRFQLTYVIEDNKFTLEVNVKNLGSHTLPFSLGWHPYFYSETTLDRQLQLNAKSKLISNESMIPIGIDNEHISKLFIDKYFDDCYKLKTNEVIYRTLDYALRLSSNSENNYLQLYTPENRNLVAIEYMTAPPNCFNSTTDLLLLKPNKEFSNKWGIQLI